MSLWREELIPLNEFSRPGTPIRVVRNIVIHYTGNPGASAANHVGYFGRVLANQDPADGSPDTYASAHLFVDPCDAVLIIPLTEMAYHASQANPYSIGVEMCIEADWTFHPDTVRQTVQIVAELCNRYGLNPLRDVIRHYDVTGKVCPKPYVDDPRAWEAFKQAADRAMRGEAEEPMLDTGVATTIINTWMVPDWENADAKRQAAEEAGDAAGAQAWQEQADYIHLLANALRVASGQPEE